MTAELPSGFTERLKQIVPPDRWEQTLASFGQERATCFRIHTLQAAAEDTVAELELQGFELHSLVYCEHAYSIPSHQRRALTESPAFYQGQIYIMNPSSMLVAAVLDPQPHERILDLAAAPGGKTLHIVDRMQGLGEVSAVEVIRGRYYKLKRLCDNYGAREIVRPWCGDGRAIGTRWSEQFDRVLLDAPCSSEARFRLDDADSLSRWTLRKIKECSRKQKRLLRSAILAAKPGATLVYCTCAFSPEENEAIISAQFKDFADFIQLEKIELPVPADQLQQGLESWQGKPFREVGLTLAQRVLPSAVLDGFFICKIRKIASTKSLR